MHLPAAVANELTEVGWPQVAPRVFKDDRSIFARPDQVAAARARWRDRFPEKLKEATSRWRKENAEHIREYQRLYRARKKLMAQRVAATAALIQITREGAP